MEMPRKIWNEIINGAGIPAESVYLDYSGRSMYGRACPGIIGGLGTFAVFMAQVGYMNAESDGVETWVDVEELGRMARTDSMGYDTIYYFPELELTP